MPLSRGWGAAGEAGGLAAAERTEFGQGGEQQRREHGADARDRAQGLGALREVGLVGDERGDTRVESGDMLGELVEMRADVLGEEIAARRLEAVALLGLDRDEV